MKLSSLIKKIKGNFPYIKFKNNNYKITGLSLNSRKVKYGNIFVAISGFKNDGNVYIKESIDKGAVAIVSERRRKLIDSRVFHIKVNNARKLLAKIASTLNKNSSDCLLMIGITGTNGKTTTSYLVEKILRIGGRKTGLIGTIGYRFGSKLLPNINTTPDSTKMHRTFSSMVESGVTHVIMEVSSHALDLYRLEGCKFKVGVFTNLSQDHLDYHKTMDKYWIAKKKLFKKYIMDDGVAVINSDDPKGKNLKREFLNKIKTIMIGKKNNCNVRPSWINYGERGIKGLIITPNGNLKIKSLLVGTFNMSNILTAVGVSIGLGISLKEISWGLKLIGQVPGRLELINSLKGAFIYVDYAHSPDALERTIKVIKSIYKKKIICIFGCGGERDRLKRSIMGEISAKLSDLTIVTLDNPRFENPKEIVLDILKGIKKRSIIYINSKRLPIFYNLKGYTIILNRRKAIIAGINLAKKGDVVLIAGKGHEKKQIIKNKILKFNDKYEIEKFLTFINQK